MNYEIFLIQNNIEEINKLPNIEDLYDMDKGSLLKLKKLFDSKFPKLKVISEKEKQKNEKLKELNNNYNNIDLDLEEDNYSDEELELREFKLNEDDETEIDLPRLYSFLLSEIKQREYQDEIVSFFLNEDSLLKFTENNFDLKSDISLPSNNNINNTNTSAESKISKNKTDINENENKNISEITNRNSIIAESVDEQGGKIIKNFNPSECSLKKIKEKLNSKSSKLAIKQMLMKTKQDNSRLLVGTNKINIYSNLNSQNSAVSNKADSNKNLSNKDQFINIADNTQNLTCNNAYNIIGQTTQSIHDPILKKKKKKERENTNDKKSRKDDLSSYIKRKNFNVPDIKTFIKREKSHSNEKENNLNKKMLNDKNDTTINTKKLIQSKSHSKGVVVAEKAIKTNIINKSNRELNSQNSHITNEEKLEYKKASEFEEHNRNEKFESYINKNIINIRNSLEFSNKYYNKSQSKNIARSIEIKLSKEKINGQNILDFKLKEKFNLAINNSLSSPIELSKFKTKDIKRMRNKITQENNKIENKEFYLKNVKHNILTIQKDIIKNKENFDILSKSDGQINVNDLIKKTKNSQNNVTNEKPESNQINKKDEKGNEVIKKTNEFDKNEKDGIKENQDFNGKLISKTLLDSYTILDGKLNTSANPEMISQIKQTTDEMLLKYDTSNIQNESKEEDDDSFNEEDNWNENDIDSVENSAYLKINEKENEKLNILKNFENQKNTKEISNKIKSSENYKDNTKSSNKNILNIKIFGSSGLKETQQDIEEIKTPYKNNNNSEENLKDKENFLKTQNEDYESNAKNFEDQENLLFYETGGNNNNKNINHQILQQTNDFRNSSKNSINTYVSKNNMKKKKKNLTNKNNFNRDDKGSPIKKQINETTYNQRENYKSNEKCNIDNSKNLKLNDIKNENKVSNIENKTIMDNRNHDNKNATTNFFNNKNLNKTGTMKLSNYKESRAYSGKIPMFNLQKQKIIISNTIPDYTKHFSTFNEILNGFYISSDAKGFDSEGALRMLYENFKNLYIFELKEDKSNAKANLINKNIVDAENEIIKNRIRKVSEFLLNDQNYLSEERYYIFKKIQELQKKDSYNIYSSRNNHHNKNDDLIENDQNQLSENLNKNIEFFLKNKMFFRVVLSRPEIYDIMCYTLGKKEEWRELPHGLLLGQSWNLLWTYSSPGINFSNLFTWQKVNHYINNRQISRKDLLKKSIDRIKKLNSRLTNLFDIMPKTYILAKEYLDFVDEFTRNKNNPNNLWIVKPVGKSRGRGIFLINELCDVPMVDSFLVQKYLTTPFLIDGYKFDMRIYVLLTSVNPLEAFLYKDGFARVSNMKFSIGNIDNKLVHLTNAAIQNKLAAKGQTYEKVFGGSKISLDLLKQKMHRARVDFDKQIWPQVKSIVLKSLIACQHDMPHCPSSFELFGYDIIIDQDLKCWLLEVNSSPSLDRSSVLDDDVKLQLVDDILNLVNPMNFDRNALIEVLERRLNLNKSSASLNKNIGNNANNNVYLYSPSVQLNLDLNNIFKGEMPRMHGEIPKKIGNFEMIAPSDESNHLIKITGGEKKYNNKKIN